MEAIAMNPLIVSVNPGNDYAFYQNALLDGVTVQLHFRWLDRLNRWFMTVTTVDGETALTMQNAVAPGGRVLWDVRRDDVPNGYLYWQGIDPYNRLDLGERVILYYVPTST